MILSLTFQWQNDNKQCYITPMNIVRHWLVKHEFNSDRRVGLADNMDVKEIIELKYIYTKMYLNCLNSIVSPLIVTTKTINLRSKVHKYANKPLFANSHRLPISTNSPTKLFGSLDFTLQFYTAYIPCISPPRLVDIRCCIDKAISS